MENSQIKNVVKHCTDHIEHYIIAVSKITDIKGNDGVEPYIKRQLNDIASLQIQEVVELLELINPGFIISLHYPEYAESLALENEYRLEFEKDAKIQEYVDRIAKYKAFTTELEEIFDDVYSAKLEKECVRYAKTSGLNEDNPALIAFAKEKLATCFDSRTFCARKEMLLFTISKLDIGIVFSNLKGLDSENPILNLQKSLAEIVKKHEKEHNLVP